MKLSTVLSPLSPENLRLAAQCGVEGVVTRYPGPHVADLLATKTKIEAHGLELAGIEGFLPIEKIKTGTDKDGAELRTMKVLIEQMGEAEIPLLCYNFMAGTDWVRTRLDAPERGGARVTAFSLDEAGKAMSLNSVETSISTDPISAEVLWENLEAFLKELIPVAEKAGVTLAMHPDDPPLPEFSGKARIMNSVENFERLFALVPSERNAMCFCQGTFATMGVDIPTTIDRLGNHIAYVHFRDVRGTAESFVETFHDNGPTDMAAAIRSLKNAGFTGPIRPDHVPEMEGDADGEPGYTMLGRLFAFGYIRGLLHGTID
ncbi:mannonate dehydratase [Verrucomicrobiales bacterium]|nr:mannonate dehydratase [Verrucomicrobiales bacterium]MDC0275467.1 mannonate dehydratase [Verrucomicrobiales bacterium]